MIGYACAYPTRVHLKGVVDSSNYAGRPYALEIALGEPSLAIRTFDLSILEIYRNDPRYDYTTNDISGRISARSSSLGEREQIYLQTFGFAYDEDLNRAVAVPIHYLTDLTPEHQQMWKTKELGDGYFLHPDYDRQMRGEWPERISIFDAFIEELKLVNVMSGLMKRPPLFKNDFEKDRPAEFTFLIRPTLTELNNFVVLLDKMMSDNINKKFFLGEVEEQDEIVRGDEKIEVRQRGTIRLLEEWLKGFRTADRKPLQDMIATFKEVRARRQKPSHAHSPNVFDQKHSHEQRELIVRAYDAVRTEVVSFV